MGRGPLPLFFSWHLYQCIHIQTYIPVLPMLNVNRLLQASPPRCNPPYCKWLSLQVLQVVCVPDWYNLYKPMQVILMGMCCVSAT